MITRRLELPGAEFFSTRRAETIPLENLGVLLHGTSFARPACPESLAIRYPPRTTGRFNIGVLHTSLSGAEGHAVYAPCSVAELAAKGYDYWALGHVHQARRVADDPWIIYPGNLQGRNIRETGAKGSVRVTVRDGVVAEVDMLVLDAARWAVLPVRLDGRTTLAEALAAFRRALQGAVDAADGRPLAVRVRLEGTTALHGRLAYDSEQFRADLMAAAAHVADGVMIEKQVLATEPVGDVAGAASLPDGVHQALIEVAHDPALANQLAAELEQIQARLPAELFASADERPFDPADAASLLEQAVAAALSAAEGAEL